MTYIRVSKKGHLSGEELQSRKNKNDQIKHEILEKYLNLNLPFPIDPTENDRNEIRLDLYLKSYWILNEWKSQVSKTNDIERNIKTFFLNDLPIELEIVILNEISIYIWKEELNIYDFELFGKWNNPKKTRSLTTERKWIKRLRAELYTHPSEINTLEELDEEAATLFVAFSNRFELVVNRLENCYKEDYQAGSKYNSTKNLDRLIAILNTAMCLVVSRDPELRKKTSKSDSLDLFIHLAGMFGLAKKGKPKKEAIRKKIERLKLAQKNNTLHKQYLELLGETENGMIHPKSRNAA